MQSIHNMYIIYSIDHKNKLLNITATHPKNKTIQLNLISIIKLNIQKVKLYIIHYYVAQI